LTPQAVSGGESLFRTVEAASNRTMPDARMGHARHQRRRCRMMLSLLCRLSSGQRFMSGGGSDTYPICLQNPCQAESAMREKQEGRAWSTLFLRRRLGFWIHTRSSCGVSRLGV
jgi:hypothetical protein